MIEQADHANHCTAWMVDLGEDRWSAKTPNDTRTGASRLQQENKQNWVLGRSMNYSELRRFSCLRNRLFTRNIEMMNSLSFQQGHLRVFCLSCLVNVLAHSFACSTLP